MRIRNTVADLAVAAARFNDFAEANRLPQPVRTHVSIALDEILTNVVMYGWEDGGSHEIEISFTYVTNRVEVEIVDDGLPFDPLHDKGAAGPQTTSRGIAIGGRGLRFVRKLMSDIRYERSQGCNRLTLIKNIAPQPSP